MRNIILTTLLVVFGCGAITVAGMYFSYNNKEIALRAKAEAQVGKIEGVHDKMWKIIQQEAQITSEYKDAFAKIYPDIISGRYSGNGDGSLMKWVTEQNPNFDTSLYKNLMLSIETLRSEFQRNQETMLDIVREHNVLINIFPNRLFITNKTPINYTVISSTKSKVVMDTGIDDDVKLF